MIDGYDRFIGIARRVGKVSFLHIPKCGGTFVEGVLTKNGLPFQKLGHMSLDRSLPWSSGYCHFKEPVAPIFAVVRNPLDLLVSHYYHSPPGCGHIGWNFARRQFGECSFSEFVKGYCESERWDAFVNFNKFMYFQLFRQDGSCPVLLLRFESMEKALGRLIRDVYDVSEPSFDCDKNKSSPRNSRSYLTEYDDETLDMLRRKCRREMDMLGYDEGEPSGSILASSSSYRVKEDAFSLGEICLYYG